MYPILEFDEERKSVINPEDFIEKLENCEYCVITFFKEVLDKLNNEGELKLKSMHYSEMGEHPLYEIEFEGKKIGVYLSGVGGPLAIGMFEEVIAHGYTKFIACGSAGVLDKEIATNKIVIPTSAIRDEGISYHYLPASREVIGNEETIITIEEVLKSKGISYLKGKTWTTDAFFRETIEKVKKRKEEGSVTVEMEAASFMAVAEFRGIKFGQILYGGDDVSGEYWDTREWKDKSVREKIFWLAVEACSKI
ncbi:nucleoside phosphorylase [Haliovirga abyssi]|uniref:Uridine phosphorylase n=1 Tax=Haliovirga abyssi TaxID=2996794 RepID=A0AAU9DMI1_9FUSO|nr:nucleoside phosphorylase [Haliovirga abyssi]BDU49498.1 uridine phosphorylase [Haliovirga abyssi]